MGGRGASSATAQARTGITRGGIQMGGDLKTFANSVLDAVARVPESGRFSRYKVYIASLGLDAAGRPASSRRTGRAW